MKKILWAGIVWCLMASGVWAGENAYLEFVIKKVEAGKSQEVQILGITTVKGDEFEGNSSVGMVGEKSQGVQSSLKVEGELKAEGNSTKIQVSGKYTIYFGSSEEGIDISGEFTASALLNKNQEVLLNSYAIPEENSQNKTELKVYVTLK